MAQAWIKEVAIADVVESKAYFLSNKGPMGYYSFYSEWMSGKRGWSSKPGIAVQFFGTDQFKAELSKHPDWVALEIPADADKRWRARKPVPNYRKRK